MFQTLDASALIVMVSLTSTIERFDFGVSFDMVCGFHFLGEWFLKIAKTMILAPAEAVYQRPLSLSAQLELVNGRLHFKL